MRIAPQLFSGTITICIVVLFLSGSMARPALDGPGQLCRDYLTQNGRVNDMETVFDSRFDAQTGAIFLKAIDRNRRLQGFGVCVMGGRAVDVPATKQATKLLIAQAVDRCVYSPTSYCAVSGPGYCHRAYIRQRSPDEVEIARRRAESCRAVDESSTWFLSEFNEAFSKLPQK